MVFWRSPTRRTMNTYAVTVVALSKRTEYNVTGEKLAFNETAVGEFSTLEKYVDGDEHAAKRKYGKSTFVTTITLSDLLNKHQAPRVMDYLSIDTEGSEYAILKTFDFSRYQFRVKTCEVTNSAHGVRSKKIHDLLTENGYVLRCRSFSYWDEWYVHLALSKES